MLLTKAEATARNVLKNFGIDTIQSLTSIQLKDIIQAQGAFYEEIDLKGKDGRIITHQDKSIISIDKSITDSGKKRFTAAHELGHFELHKNLVVCADTPYELYNWFQSGSHEKEANEFASELLMPTKLFEEECKDRKFNPALIEHLATSFIVSRTAAILKFVKSGNHPICVVCVKDNKVQWWKMSKQMEDAEHAYVDKWARYKMRITSRLPPPADSVVGKLIKGYSRRLQNQETYSEIEKSTWFVTRPGQDSKMYEYCNFTLSYNFGLSVIWED